MLKFVRNVKGGNFQECYHRWFKRILSALLLRSVKGVGLGGAFKLC